MTEFDLMGFCMTRECHGGLREVSRLSVEFTVSTVLAALSLAASQLAVIGTLLLCKYRLVPTGSSHHRLLFKSQEDNEI